MKRITVITSLFNCGDYLEGYFEAAGKIVNPDDVEILLIHNDPNDAELAIIDKYLSQLPFITHIVVPREGLYASWNRGIKMASTKYVAIWNVDDIRTPDSLVLQLNALESGQAVMCYGDFYGTSEYGYHKETFYQYKPYPVFKSAALRIHIIGCFPMWRKDIHDQVGYYDEQFKLVSDYEFQIRVAKKYDLVKCKSFLGYYLENQGHKLSSNKDLQYRERTVVELRYRLYDKVMLHVVPFISAFRIRYYLNFGEWYPLSSVVPKGISLKSIGSFILAPVTYSFWLIKKLFDAVYNFFF